ncbi:pilus assembly protein CpaD [Altererythrobacter salegens]|uniref:Pilus assembly protein CpaD n=1 Tax=Croceibacterium salegens TaxID=1737568 RepID=A0A6I4SQE9_9SPHN|nr:CpaD family pilus assembly protein [Croceibacterium salegens]MXO58083.1 pilus assembly protein CpaD [Croceibacterium salegens]
MSIATNKALTTALALSLGLATGACATNGAPKNYSLDSVNQPVIERANYALDLTANSTGLPVTEQGRLIDWFDSLGLGYGDRVSIDDPMSSVAVHDAVAKLAGRYGLLVSAGAPVTEGYVDPGKVRVVVTRSHAAVPNCPNWDDKLADYGDNATHSGFGCAVNGNIAAMIADPEHLLHGASGTGETVVMSSSKAIKTYREAKPTGADGLPAVSSQEGGK